MLIEAIEIEQLRLPLDPPFHAAWDPEPRTAFDAALVRVFTDTGLCGIGSGDAMTGLGAHAHRFLGRDPLALADHGRALETIAFHGAPCWPLEAALWDLAGQAAGLPVARLLGGARDRIPAYASLGELRSPDARARDAHALVAAGFRAVKVRIAPADAERGLAVLAAIREAVGDALAIVVDLNQWWRMAGDTATGLDPVGARAIIARLGELGVLWVEEPLPGADLAGMAQLRAHTGVRIAGGEMARSFDELDRALRADALDVVQPDVVLALGIGGARTLGELALRRNRWFTPHTWTNGIGLLANLHVCCGVGGGPVLEYPYDPPGWTPERRDFMLAAPVALDADGCVAVPDAPGLGVALDEDAVARHRVSSQRWP